MISARELPARDYEALKDGTADLVKACKSRRAASRITRVSHTQLGRYASRDELDEEVFLPVDIVADLEALAGRPIVTDALAALTGHVLVHLPEVAKSNTPLGKITGEAMRETSEVFSALGERLASGKLGKRDLTVLRREIRVALAALPRLDIQLDAEVGNV
jgi:hypothetical protein